ncbi:MAG: hypothetical protein WBD20_16555 [Pirellulaceae bacterium]
MSSSDNAPLTLTDILAGAWRQKWFAIPLFLLLSLFCAAMLWVLPNRYASEAQLLVRLGPNAVAMDPKTDLSHTVSLQESRLHQVNSVMELINSREMIERVAKQVGTDRILEPIGFIENAKAIVGGLLPKQQATSQNGYSATEIKELVELGEACKRLERGLSASVGKDAYTIDISYISNSPFLSHDVVAALLEQYPRYHARAHGSTGSVEFFDREVAATLETATESQSKLRDLKVEMGIVDLDSEKVALQEKLSELERSSNSTSVQLAEVQAELASLKTELTSMPDRIVAEETTGIFKHSGALVRQGLYELELKEKELSTKFNSDHPKMQAARDQLQQARMIANSEIGQAPQVRNVANPIRQEMDLLYRQAIAKQAGLQAKKEQLQKQLSAAKEQLVTLNTASAELTRLTWDADVAASTYVDAAKRLANAKQVADLEALELSDVAIAQQATLQLTKTGPLRLYIGAACLAVVGFITLLLAALRDSGRSNTSPNARPTKRKRVSVWNEPSPRSREPEASAEPLLSESESELSEATAR